MKTTDAAIAYKPYRQLRRLQNMSIRIQTKASYLQKQNKLTPAAKIRADRTNKLISQQISLLDNKNNNNPHPILTQPVNDVMTEIFREHNVNQAAQLTTAESITVEKMKKRNQEAAAGNLQFRLMCEIALAAHNKSFIVFDTLTVAPHHYSDTFSKDSRAWINYIRKFKATINRSLGGTKRKEISGINHRYLGVIEPGGKTGRLHLHVLHIFDKHNFRDPNLGSPDPRKRIISELVPVWEKGHSMPIAVRHLNDAYKQQGWRWPTDNAGPLVQKSAQAIAGYMSKYITKSHSDFNRKDHYPWRTKKTKSFGTTIIDQTIKKLTDQQLITLAMIETIRPKINNRMIPRSMINRQTMKEIQNRSSIQNLFPIMSELQPRPSRS